MLAGENVSQKRLGIVEFLFAAAYLFQVPIYHLVTSYFVAMQDCAYICQTEAHTLASLNDTEPAKMFFAIVSVP